MDKKTDKPDLGWQLQLDSIQPDLGWQLLPTFDGPQPRHPKSEGAEPGSRRPARRSA